MADQPGGEFRGRIERTGGPGTPADWGWDHIDDDRPRLPLIGVFLVLLGAVLLLGQAFPGVRFAGSGLVVAVGVALIVAWAAGRVGVIGLYAGMILTALSLPNLLRDLGVIAGGNGWGTLFLGLGFHPVPRPRVHRDRAPARVESRRDRLAADRRRGAGGARRRAGLRA
jgi:hypothetical protein